MARVSRLSWIFVAAPVLLLGGCETNGDDPTIDAVRAATAKYMDVRNAIADGYTTDGKCMTAPMIGYPAEEGAMGLHYVRKDMIGIVAGKPDSRVSGNNVHTDFLNPSMLVYEPQPDGSLQLVAVENLVFESAWYAKGRSGPPRFRGTDYVLLKDDPATPVDEAHKFEPHYELHIWAFKANPNGLYAEFNPDVTCSNAKPTPTTK